VTPAEVVQTLVEHLNQNRIDAAAELLAVDVFYHNIPMEPITGRHAWRDFTDQWGLGTRFRANWGILAIAQSNDVVLTERIDEFSTADGRKITIPVMGSFRVHDGVITEWSDYFDKADLQSQLDKLDPPTDSPDIDYYIVQWHEDRLKTQES
jgi:limonene-1,2-epoxide hydrolase